MLKTNITEEERNILVAFNRSSPILLTRLKAQAIMSSDQGLSSKSIALNVGKSIRAIERWLSCWNKQKPCCHIPQKIRKCKYKSLLKQKTGRKAITHNSFIQDIETTANDFKQYIESQCFACDLLGFRAGIGQA